jgi:hypothetical protein
MSRNHDPGIRPVPAPIYLGVGIFVFVHVLIITSGTLSQLNIDYDAVIDERDSLGFRETNRGRW